jgi:hypothetical protein
VLGKGPGIDYGALCCTICMDTWTGHGGRSFWNGAKEHNYASS